MVCRSLPNISMGILIREREGLKMRSEGWARIVVVAGEILGVILQPGQIVAAEMTGEEVAEVAAVVDAEYSLVL